MALKTFCDATGQEMTAPMGWVEIAYATIGPEASQERLILCPEAGALVIDAIERIIRPQNNVLELFGGEPKVLDDTMSSGQTLAQMAEDDGA